MLSRMNRLCLWVGLLLVLSSMNARAQKMECFSVTMTNATTGAPLGAILLDRCSGNAWVLVRIDLPSGGTALRWSPLSVEKSELVTPRSAP
jgi:hypothetical protein